MKAELVYDAKAILGEGPVWDPRSNSLLWMDIEKGELHFLNTSTLQDEFVGFGKRISAVVPTYNEGELIVALEDGIALYNKNRYPPVNYIALPESHLPDNRFNDGKCDPMGRFWVGSMDMKGRMDRAALYCVDRNLTIEKRISDISTSNGLAWNRELNTMYHIDSPTYSVMAFDYNPEDATIKNSRPVIDVPKNHGSPDGMCIDEEGMLWIAHWDGFNVSRWNPEDGKLILKIALPVPKPTSCTFGGKDLKQLYVTSARSELSREIINKYPTSGGIFVIETKVKGFQSDFFFSPL